MPSPSIRVGHGSEGRCVGNDDNKIINCLSFLYMFVGICALICCWSYINVHCIFIIFVDVIFIVCAQIVEMDAQKD